MSMELKKPRQDEVRNLIRANRIIVRLQQFVLGRKFQGAQVKMSAAQVRAALGLLNKILPDLSAVNVVADLNHSYVARTPQISPSAEQWTAEHAPTIQ